VLANSHEAVWLVSVIFYLVLTEPSIAAPQGTAAHARERGRERGRTGGGGRGGERGRGEAFERACVRAARSLCWLHAKVASRPQLKPLQGEAQLSLKVKLYWRGERHVVQCDAQRRVRQGARKIKYILESVA